MKYARAQKKGNFSISRERLANFVDELFPADEEGPEDFKDLDKNDGPSASKVEEATDRELHVILADPKSVRKIARNILTHDQLWKAIE